MTNYLASLFEKDKIYKTHIGDSDRVYLPENVQVLIVLHPDSFSVNDKEQLQKIMAACNFLDNQYFVAKEKSSWKEYRNNSLKFVFLFGIDEKNFGLQINIPQHKTIEFDNVKWIKTASLHNLSEDSNIKTELWQQVLKPLFAG